MSDNKRLAVVLSLLAVAGLRCAGTAAETAGSNDPLKIIADRNRSDEERSSAFRSFRQQVLVYEPHPTGPGFRPEGVRQLSKVAETLADEVSPNGDISRTGLLARSYLCELADIQSGRLNEFRGKDPATLFRSFIEAKDFRIQYQVVLALAEARSNYKNQALSDNEVASFAAKARECNDPIIRGQAARALEAFGGSSGLNELRKIAKEDKDEDNRRNATVAVANSSPKVERDFLRDQTHDSSVHVRLAAYWALSYLGDKSGRDLALQVLDHNPVDRDRDEAISVLGRTGRSEDAPYFKKILDANPNRPPYRVAEAYNDLQLLQKPAPFRLGYLLRALDDPMKSEWASVALYNSPSLLTNLRLSVYMLEPWPSGKEKAWWALDARRHSPRRHPSW